MDALSEYTSPEVLTTCLNADFWKFLPEKDNKSRYEYLSNTYRNQGLLDAARNGSIELTNYFLFKGANKYGSAMVEASKHGHTSIVKLMIDLDSRKSSMTHKDYKVALDNAVENANSEMISILLQNGANSSNAIVISARKGFISYVEFFYNLGQGLSETALLEAAKYNHREIVNFLILKGVDPIFAFKGACEGGHKEIIDELINLGIFNYNYGMTYSAKGGHKDLVNYFIDKGGDDYYNALNAASRNGHIDIVKYLIDKTPDNIPGLLLSASESGQLQVVKMLADLIPGCTEDFTESFEAAASKGHLDIVKFFIENRLVYEYTGALSEATSGNHKDVMEYLLSKTIDKNFYKAVYEGNFDAVKILLKYEPTNYDDAIKIATQNKDLDIIDLINNHLTKK